MNSRSVIWLCPLAALAIGCRQPASTGNPAGAPQADVAPGPICFNDLTSETGITFRHTDGSSGHRYIVESVSAGLALFDYDADGLIDIYFLNGTPLRGSQDKSRPTNALYRNEGNWRFRDVSQEAGVADPGYGLGVAVGDYDNDGNVDLYLNNFGPNVLYRNRGDGTFTDVTKSAGVQNGDKVGAGASFLDIEGDGDLDLYVANYVDFTYENHVPCTIGGLPAYAGPLYYEPVPDVLYRNNGDGTFTDVSEESGIGRHAGSGMGMVCCDYDNDGDQDIFVCNDSRRNFFFRNDGKGRFEEVALVVGIAYNFFGDANASMGVDCADYNNDGYLDFFMTNYQGETPVLYQNSEAGFFDDVSRRTGAGAGTYPYVTWGVGMVDFDNDTHRDLFIACGHLDDNVELRDDTTAYAVKNVLLRNDGSNRFEDVSASAGNGMAVRQSSRGAAFDDLDNDGDIDVVVLNSRQPPSILRNDSTNDNHWIQVRLVGTKSNRDAVGARVQVVAGSLVQIDEVHSGRGYQSHFGSRLHFGLGQHDRVDRVEVRWPSGAVDVIKDVEVDRLITIEEGGRLEESQGGWAGEPI